MPAIVTIVIVLMILAVICLSVILLHNRQLKQQAGSLSAIFKKIAERHQLKVSLDESLSHTVFGIDPAEKKLLMVRRSGNEQCQTSIIDLSAVKGCRKEKQWLHIPAGKTSGRPETHLEKLTLQLQYPAGHPPAEIVFYEYRYNSIFQLNSLEQKADFWELLINQQIKLQ